MRGRIESMSMSLDGTTLQVALAIPNGRQHIKVFSELGDKDADITIKRYRNKRSLDANAYMWVLLDRLAAKLSVPGASVTKDELYLDYIRQYGVSDYLACRDRAIEAISNQFRVVEDMGKVHVGQEVLTCLRCYYGTSEYNTEEMSRLINAIVEDCREMGIETATPDEQERMMRLWDENHR